MSETALDIRLADLATAPKSHENREKGVLERKAAISEPLVSEKVPGAVELEAKQKKERKEVDDRYAAMREIVKKLHEIQNDLYDRLGILPKTEDNSGVGKFKKGLVDALVTENVEFLKVVAEQGVEAVIKALATMLSSVENVKKLISSAVDGMKAKAENLLDIDAYSIGKSLGWMGFGVLGMVRSWVREGVTLGVKEAVQGLGHLATFKIPLWMPPVLTGTRIYECAELVSREMVLKGPEETKKLLDLIESTGQYLAKHGHEAKALANYERRQFEWSLDLLVTNSIRIVNDAKIPPYAREAVAASLKMHLLPAYQTGHKIPHFVS